MAVAPHSIVRGVWGMAAVMACAGTLRSGAVRGAEPVAPPALNVPRLTLDAFDAQATENGAAALKDFTGFSLEDLMNIEVTSASRHKQKMSDVAAALYVITADDIRRTQYQNIPDLLSLAPGISVAQFNSGTYAIGSRGGGFRYTPNLLVMMDGRSVYSPVFAGVSWNTVDYVMADLDRIEVIRGPGATLWGANAVNGVISISTKEAKDTQGALVDSYAGTDGLINSFRYGGKLGENTWYRVYGKSRDAADFNLPGGESNRDGWTQERAGFRVDSNLTPADKLTIQGDFFDSRVGAVVVTPTATPPFNQTIHGPFNSGGGNLEGRYTHTFSESSDLSVQFYYDNMTNTGREGYDFDSSINTLDLELQHRFALGDRQEVIWGGDYRFTHGDLKDNPATGFTTDQHHVDLQIASGFVQDDVTLIPKRLHIIGGTKVEFDSLTGVVELQPSIRGIWTPDEKNTLWAAVSRAARTPGLHETTLRPTVGQVPLPNGTAMNLVSVPNPNISSEHLMAYEVGYRLEPAQGLSIDLAAFYNAYDHSRGIVAGAPGIVGGQLVLPAEFRADRGTQGWGFELGSTWNATDRLRLSGSYSYLNIMMFGGPPSLLPLQDPESQLKMQVYYDVTKDIDLSSEFYSASKVGAAEIPASFRWDIGAAWRPEKHTEFRVGVRNLLDNQHQEFSGNSKILGGAEVPRTFYVELQVKF